MKDDDRFLIGGGKQFEWITEDVARFKKVSRSLTDLLRVVSKGVKVYKAE